ncbi:hypothetical protein HKD37_U058508 [Glycine soja]
MVEAFKRQTLEMQITANNGITNGEQLISDGGTLGSTVSTMACLHHGLPGLCFEGQLLRLVGCCIEGLAVVILLVAGGGFHLEPTVVGIL